MKRSKLPSTYVSPREEGGWIARICVRGIVRFSRNPCPLKAIHSAIVSAQMTPIPPIRKRLQTTGQMRRFFGARAEIGIQALSPKRMDCREYAPGGYRVRMKRYVP